MPQLAMHVRASVGLQSPAGESHADHPHDQLQVCVPPPHDAEHACVVKGVQPKLAEASTAQRPDTHASPSGHERSPEQSYGSTPRGRSQPIAR